MRISLALQLMVAPQGMQAAASNSDSIPLLSRTPSSRKVHEFPHYAKSPIGIRKGSLLWQRERRNFK